jgi:hypothetical protein
MIELILLIASLSPVDRVEDCTKLIFREQSYVITYKNKRIYWDTFYRILCDDTKVQAHILKIKRWE